ncbi:MAG: hypothetical protein V1816_25530 [Pseudomonadota bacterium]
MPAEVKVDIQRLGAVYSILVYNTQPDVSWIFSPLSPDYAVNAYSCRIIGD